MFDEGVSGRKIEKKPFSRLVVIAKVVVDGTVRCCRAMTNGSAGSNGHEASGVGKNSAAEQNAALAHALGQQYLAVNTRWAAIPASATGYPTYTPATVIPQAQYWGAAGATAHAAPHTNAQ